MDPLLIDVPVRLYCRRLHAWFLQREDLAMCVFERDAGGGATRPVSATGSPRIDWVVRSMPQRVTRRYARVPGVA